MFSPNKFQKAVIDIHETNALVLAAPGCGKTEILSQRIIKAHKDYNVAYEDMICLTFTNRASREMKNRIKEVLGNEASGLFVWLSKQHQNGHVYGDPTLYRIGLAISVPVLPISDAVHCIRPCKYVHPSPQVRASEIGFI